MRLFAGDTEQISVHMRFDPDRPACAAPVINAVRATAQRQHGSMRKRRGIRQPLEPSLDPGTVLLRAFPCLPPAAALRHRENPFTVGGMDAQRVTAGLSRARPPR